MIVKNEFMQVVLVCKMSWDEKILQTPFVDCIEFICFIDLIKLSFICQTPDIQAPVVPAA